MCPKGGRLRAFRVWFLLRGKYAWHLEGGIEPIFCHGIGLDFTRLSIEERVQYRGLKTNLLK